MMQYRNAKAAHFSNEYIFKAFSIEGLVTQRCNSIFCQNEYLISKCSEKCGLSRKHKDSTPPKTPLKSMASET